MSEQQPAWVKGEYGTSYEEIVNSWGYEVLEFETFGQYQGDHLALLRDGDRLGLIVFGYGSCSGCDELQAIEPWGGGEDDDWTEVIEFAERLRSEVHWSDSRSDLRDWVNQTPENHWWSYDDEVRRWLVAQGLMSSPTPADPTPTPPHPDAEEAGQ